MANRLPQGDSSDQPTVELTRADATQPFDPAAEAPTSVAPEVDPNPATPAGPGAATPDVAVGVASATTDVPLAIASVGSGGAAGSGRPHQALGVCWCGQQHATMEAVQLNSESSTAGSGRPRPFPRRFPRERDGKGRFLAKPAIPPMSAGLAQALLDADAETWRVDNATRTARVLVYAIEFDDLVRHAAGDGGS